MVYTDYDETPIERKKMETTPEAVFADLCSGFAAVCLVLVMIYAIGALVRLFKK